jgi:hypothetical protein
MKIIEVDHIFGYFLHSMICALISTKNGLGYSLGDYFRNSSGHPGDNQKGEKIIVLLTHFIEVKN